MLLVKFRKFCENKGDGPSKNGVIKFSTENTRSSVHGEEVSGNDLGVVTLRKGKGGSSPRWVGPRRISTCSINRTGLVGIKRDYYR